MTNKRFRWLVVSITTMLTGCAVLHHVQLGDIDDRSRGKLIDLKVSETGINLKEAAAIAKYAMRSKAREISAVENIVSAFQMGPRTGNMVFDEKYADQLVELLSATCASGKITNLMTVRESAKYPVVSGEIIKIKGTCNE